MNSYKISFSSLLFQKSEILARSTINSSQRSNFSYFTSSIGSSLTIATVRSGKIDYFFSFFVLLYISLDDGSYIIIQIRSAAEFYGLSQNRQHDFEVLSKEFEQYYNNSANDQSLTVPVISEGTPSVIEQYDKYYRVIIKQIEKENF